MDTKMHDLSDIPYFMTNEEWYVTPENDMFFDDGRGYHLSEKAPQEAIDSYNALYGDDSVDVEIGGAMQKMRLL